MREAAAGQSLSGETFQGTYQVWLWPNLLSLDAPVVAVLWQILFARCLGAPLEAPVAFLLLLTVWLIYAADRCFDAWRGECPSPRHQFYKSHWRSLMPIWIAVLLVTAWLALTGLPAVLFLRGMVLLLGVLLYLALVHLGPRRWSGIRRWSGPRRWRWHSTPTLPAPKELAVGAAFGMGATLAAWGYVKTPADIGTILIFSCLCWWNCVAIQRWENSAGDWSPAAGAIVVALAACLLVSTHRPILGGAELASTLAFLLLDRVRRRLSVDAVRVLADVALLSPVLFLPLRHG